MKKNENGADLPEYLVVCRPVDTVDRRGIAPNNSPSLYIEVLCTVPFTHFLIDFYEV